MAQRKAITKQMARRYAKASRVEKTRMLDELCALTGYAPAREPVPAGRPQDAGGPTAPTEIQNLRADMLEPLTFVWAPERPVRQAAGSITWPMSSVPWSASGSCGSTRRSDPSCVRCPRQRSTGPSLPSVSACGSKGRSGTKPGSMLKRQIPIRTFAEWDDARPGFCEVDLVAHDGGSGTGEFCQTLDLTCVATGWTEPRALRNKAQRWVHEAIDEITRVLPFPLVGLDSDNGAEFINMHLYRYWTERGITFTRSRPYRKNDNCYVEQKNWPVVRQQVGYARYDTPEELEGLRELYRVLRLYVNFFQPQMKLVSKTRHGAKVTKRFDLARPPTSEPWTLPTWARRPRDRFGGPTHAEPGPAEAGPGCVPDPTPRAHRQQDTPKGGGIPTRSSLQARHLQGRGLEDIFGDATDGCFEDTLT